MPEFIGYFHERSKFDVNLFKTYNAFVVQEFCKDDGIHHHFWIKTDHALTKTRKWLTDNMSNDRGHKAYSIKLSDPEQFDKYLKYCAKGVDEATQPVVIHNAPRHDFAKLHDEYWSTNKQFTKVSKDNPTRNSKPAFAKHLITVFENKYLEEYKNNYVTDWTNKYHYREFNTRRYEYLANIVMKELDAETKVFDAFILKRFVLLIENRFNPEDIRSKLSKQIADSINTFD